MQAERTATTRGVRACVLDREVCTQTGNCETFPDVQYLILILNKLRNVSLSRCLVVFLLGWI